jgi:tripartite-type tricarboxylate transporter receptor subunit TctC
MFKNIYLQFMYLSAVTGLAATAATAAAQNYPLRPIRLVVPQSAGGSTDLVARPLAQRVAEALKGSVVVDNRPGAGSTIGTDIAAKAPPDGYTLLAVAASFTMSPSLTKNCRLIR